MDAAAQSLYASVLCPEFLQCTIMHPAWCIIIQDQHRSSRVQDGLIFELQFPVLGADGDSALQLQRQASHEKPEKQEECGPEMSQ